MANNGQNGQKRGHRGHKPEKFTGTAVFVYTSKCCGATATKTPCARTKEDKKAGTFSESCLGTWQCPACASKCKVTRTQPKAADVKKAEMEMETEMETANG
jgi:hypothetical protein